MTALNTGEASNNDASNITNQSGKYNEKILGLTT